MKMLVLLSLTAACLLALHKLEPETTGCKTFDKSCASFDVRQKSTVESQKPQDVRQKSTVESQKPHVLQPDPYAALSASEAVRGDAEAY